MRSTGCTPFWQEIKIITTKSKLRKLKTGKFWKITFLLMSIILSGELMKDVDSAEKDRIPIFNAETNKVEQVEKIYKTDAQWKKLLTPEQYRVTRLKGTELPFSGKCDIGQPGGIYKCVCCGTDLFRVDEKFESGTGWPSFWNPLSELNIKEEKDDSLGMGRVEVLCARCGAHLGHVFEDGPPPTHKRYCINAEALKFMPLARPSGKLEKCAFAAGCFWGVEEHFRNLKGVVNTSVGYAGGRTINPTYEEVCSNTTGHAETLELEYDPGVISYEKLLDEFWKMHDPTAVNRQGPDVGTQYRSAIFYYNEGQRKAALGSKEKLEKSGKYKKKIATEVLPAGAFYRAEDYHQKYYMKKGIKACPE